ncbi:MAG TPA: mechanosensitive ion channel family protein [Xanthobacteraceae bacterium]|nr:mechanosensitive ion channel family protein [Xanthobacteraceae bacterium]
MDIGGIVSRGSQIVSGVPGWTLGIVLLVVVALAALLAHTIAVAVIRHALSRRHAYTLSLLRRTIAPSRLALVTAAMALALPSAPFDPQTAAWLSRIFGLVFLGLLGWIAFVAVDIGADLYVARFELTSEDNLLARKHITQVRILRRAIDTLVVVITIAAMLMSFDAVRQYGLSLFASAGVAGIVAGLAARPLLSNLIAGVQLAMAQPIRLEDAVVIENEFGNIEEITSTYVVVRLWDWRRMIVPLSYFIEKPFQNWTRESSALIGTVLLHVDYTVPVVRVREKLEEIVRASRLWDGKVVNLQVTDATERTVELRALVSAANSGAAWDLRCEVREKLVAFLQAEYPQALPRARAAVTLDSETPDARAVSRRDGRAAAR